MTNAIDVGASRRLLNLPSRHDMDNIGLIALASLATAAATYLLSETIFTAWDALSNRFVGDLIEDARKISFDLSRLNFYLRLWGAALVAALTLGLVTNRFLLGFGVAFVFAVAPRPILQNLLRRRRRLLKDQLIVAIGLIVNSAKAIASLEQIFESAAKETPAPLGDEFRRVVVEYERGRTFEETLQSEKERIQLQDFAIFATTLIANQKHGGPLVDTLVEIQKSLVENQRLERKLEADVATGRMVVNFLSIAPVLFMLISAFINPEGASLMFNTIAGQATLLAALFLTYAGNCFGRKVTNVEF